jgi:hypothetical protein
MLHVPNISPLYFYYHLMLVCGDSYRDFVVASLKLKSFVYVASRGIKEPHREIVHCEKKVKDDNVPRYVRASHHHHSYTMPKINIVPHAF